MLDQEYFEAVAGVLAENGFSVVQVVRKDTGQEVFVLAVVTGIAADGGLKMAPVAEFFEQAEADNLYEMPEGFRKPTPEDNGVAITAEMLGWDGETPAVAEEG